MGELVALRDTIARRNAAPSESGRVLMRALLAEESERAPVSVARIAVRVHAASDRRGVQRRSRRCRARGLDARPAPTAAAREQDRVRPASTTTSRAGCSPSCTRSLYRRWIARPSETRSAPVAIRTGRRAVEARAGAHARAVARHARHPIAIGARSVRVTGSAFAHSVSDTPVYDAIRPWQRRSLGRPGGGVSDSRPSRGDRSRRAAGASRREAARACSRSCSCTAARCCRPIGSSTRWPTATASSGATGTVQTYLSQLRKVLPQVGAELITQPSGYVLELQDDTARRRAVRVDGARRAAPSPIAGAGCDCSTARSALWRRRGARGVLVAVGGRRAGPPRPPPPRRAVQLRAEARLERGEYLEALSELDALTDEYPLDERLCGATHARGVPRRPAGRGAARRSSSSATTSRASSASSPGPSSSSSSGACSTTTPRCARARPRARQRARAGRRGRGAPCRRAERSVADHGDALRNIRASQLKLGLATVAVLITDLVGSASMRTQLGDHRADEMERWHEGVLNKAVADYQGTIVKRLGDGAMAIFTTATDAIAAAAAIQTRLARETRAERGRDARPHRDQRGRGRGGRERRARAPADRSRPPVRARRRRPDPHHALVQHLAAARSAATFRPVGAFDLKGLPGPTPLYEVPWPIGGDETVPLPDSLEPRRTSSRSSGARRELASLAEQLAATRARRARCRRRARDRRGRRGEVAARHRVRALDRRPDARTVLYGHCDEVAGYPFQPVAEWLRHYLAHASPAERRHGARAARRRSCRGSCPNSSARTRPSDHAQLAADGGDPFAAVRSGGRLVDARLRRRTGPARARRPPVGVAADARDAPAPASRAAPRFPGMLLATCRDDDVPEHRPRRAARRFDAAGPVRRVELGGLEPEDVVAMVSESQRRVHGRRSASTRSPRRSTRSRVAIRCSSRRSRGSSNPDDLRGCGAPHQPVRPPDAGDGARRQPAVRARPRHGRAPAEGRGRRDRVRVLAAAPRCAANARRRRRAVARPARRGGGARATSSSCPGTPLRYRFAHGVVRNALLETVPVSQRMRLHRLAGRGLEQLGRAGDDRTLASLAYHFSQAAALGEVRARDRVLRARGRRRDPAARARRSRRLVREGTRRRGRRPASPTTALRAAARARTRPGVRGRQGSTRRACSARIASRRGAATRRSAAEAVLSLNRGFFSRTGETDDRSRRGARGDARSSSTRGRRRHQGGAARRARVRARLGGGRRSPLRAERRCARDGTPRRRSARARARARCCAT